MNEQHLLGQLHGLHDMLSQLVSSIPEPEAYRCFHSRLAPLAWYFGRSMYLETYWLREVVQQQPDMTERVRDIFAPDGLPAAERWQRLPPRDHLLNWALELQEENIMRLANPELLPQHPILTNGRLQQLILQAHAWHYERMLMVLTQRQLQAADGYRPSQPLVAAVPEPETSSVSQGHYRIGARHEIAAYDNEEPAQVVELSSFRTARFPVSNQNWLAFMQADGYRGRELWSDQGWSWVTSNNQPLNPDHWRQDDREQWYGVGLNGAFDLTPEEPVMGICWYEAQAYANWLSNLGGAGTGAVLQHEYQWEVAARMREISGYGRVWEWCANRFEPYTDYQAPQIPEARTREFDQQHHSLRGASLHTQRPLKRPTYRNRAKPDERQLFTGARLVFPPD